MLINSELREQSARFERWMLEQALPLWAAKGVDTVSGGCFETMLATGEADKDVDRRTRVQGRQMFVFAAAAEQGWLTQGRELVEGIQDYLDRYAGHPALPGAYVFKLNSQHQPVDSKLDTYDCAFFLLAWAYQYKVFADPKASARATALMALLDNQFAADSGGYLEGDYSSPIRRQNPHMHLFEAFLAWYEASGEKVWLKRAANILVLFKRHFFEAEKGVLYEYFDAALNKAQSAEGEVVEPGHLMEWVWLLREYERFSGEPLDGYCNALYATGLRLGMDNECGLLFDEINATGQVLKVSKRLWTVTELIKAHLAQAKAGNLQAEQAAAEAIEALFRCHLGTQIPGWYIERLDNENRPVEQPAPATSMYHLMMACLETVKYCKKK
ncbi:AGE family epimerase/isomerase [Aliiglaciecola sp. CAU 1673]|uniref:AGE family epimerase/isomerase n=1 Tax=Aliiglaciecola sp. CAU 1673 TaxID=3032595 RepID=UPI0023DC4442|nr:AGE family epimerase/isomerase [Aliiglaciecola sp. CAU 1673]MDF2176703.1 AGE family epimerase/isomerase [Aliiglaciecola sp. CAU 1673]